MLANQMFPAALVFLIVLIQDLGFAAIMWGIYNLLQDYLTQLRSYNGFHF